MNGVFKLPFAATLLVIAVTLFSTSAHAAPGLKASATQVTVGDTIQIDASSGAANIPVFATNWNISQEFSLISAGLAGAKIKALTAGTGKISAKVNQKAIFLKLKVVAKKHAATAPLALTPNASAQEIVTTVSARKFSASQPGKGNL